MRKLFLVMALIATPAPAIADSVWAVTRNGVKAAEVTLTDAQQARIAQWALAIRTASVVQTPSVPPVLDGNGVIITPGVPAVMRDPTAAEAVQSLAAGFFSSMLAQATEWHRETARRSAADAVPPVVTK